MSTSLNQSPCSSWLIRRRRRSVPKIGCSLRRGCLPRHARQPLQRLWETARCKQHCTMAQLVCCAVVSVMSALKHCIRSLLPSFLPSFVHAFLPSFFPAFMPSFLPSSLPPFLPSFIHSFVLSFTHSFIYSFIHSCIRPCMHACPHLVLHEACAFMHPLFLSFALSCICPPIHLFTHSLFSSSFTCHSIQSFIHLKPVFPRVRYMKSSVATFITAPSILS